MKKNICLIIIITIIFMSGCSNKTETQTSASVTVSEEIIPVATAEPSPDPTPELIIEEKTIDACPSPLSKIVINEVRATDLSLKYDKTHSVCDWVELKNISDENVSTEGLYFTDNESNLQKMPIRSCTISPNTVVVFDLEFGLDADGETLFLTDGENIIDYVSWCTVPYYCSIGRLPDELEASIFEIPTPGENNREGKHKLSSTPQAESPDGVFNNVDSVEVILNADGDIYYTTDGTLPSVSSKLYCEPIVLTQTTVIRAVSVEPDGARSLPLNLNYFINENFTLPVLSIVEDKSSLYTMREAAKEVPIRKIESPGAVSLYDENEVLFSVPCGLTVAGQASIASGLYEKISFDVHLRSGYGQSKLGYDVFDTGFSDYSSLNIHAGQDSTYLLFDAELWQDLCLDMCDNVYTQHSKFCIMYLNGEYWGIYCIKDDITKQGYADYASVKKSSVEVCESFKEDDCNFCNEVYDYVVKNDMSDPENYAKLLEMVDMDNYMNWLIIQGISSNSDLFSNIKIYRGADGKWQWALFDLDHAMLAPEFAWNLPLGNSFYLAFPNERSLNYVNHLKQSDEFKAELANRYSQVYSNILSNESILKRIDYYESMLQPEIGRDRARWGYTVWQWEQDVLNLKNTITELDWQNYCVDKFCENLEIERTDYFN